MAPTDVQLATAGRASSSVIAAAQNLFTVRTPDAAHSIECRSWRHRQKGGRMSDFKVIVRNNGPLRLEGDITIVDQDGQPFGLAGRTVVSLCRCGHSENKPFCDGTHNKVGFQSACPARDLPPPAPKP
jgi:CDGSH-type Zn-finger protein